MSEIRKEILKDNAGRPIAVRIAYADWLAIERRLVEHPPRPKVSSLSEHAGAIRLSADPVEFQRKNRDTWNRDLS